MIKNVFSSLTGIVMMLLICTCFSKEAKAEESIIKSIEDYNKVLAINPNDAEAYFNRGNVYGQKGDFNHAIEDFNKALAINPNDADAYYNRGGAYYDKDDYDRAIEDYNKAIYIDPNNTDVYNNRAKAWYYKKQYDKAWADVKHCRKAGGTPESAFISALEEASGRKEK